MATVGDTNEQGVSELHLQLKIWHPDCWTLQVTEGNEGGLIGQGVYIIDGVVKSHLTVYGPTKSTVRNTIEEIERSPLTGEVSYIQKGYSHGSKVDSPGNSAQEVLVTYEAENSIHDCFISKGFIPDDPIRIRDGYEYWTVVTDSNRDDINEKLDEVRNEMDATIIIQQIGRFPSGTLWNDQHNQLTERQREVFNLAKSQGYYNWPREYSTENLAEDLDLTPATVLEHLRKAEAKLLGK